MANGILKFIQRLTEASGLSANETALYSKDDGNIYKKAYGGDEILVGGFSGCSLTKSTTQSIDPLTVTAVSFDGENFDTDNYHDNSVNNSRFTAPKTGFYLIGGSAEIFALADQKYYIVRINKNGTIELGRHRANASGISYLSNPYSVLIYLEEGDYVEMTVEHNNDTARNIRETTNGTSFWIYRIG